MPDYAWQPIQPLSDSDKAVDLAAIHPLYEAWWLARERLQTASPSHLKQFNDRLVRRMSIETGILERLYDLDRGTTEALVAKGFAEDLVSHTSTNIEPSRLIDLLKDQEAAVQLVVDCVANQRKLTKGFIHELHAILTQHQDTTTAVDQFGKRYDIPLLKGQFKRQPNNPKRPDGSAHEYCPPVHVDAEVEKLLAWVAGYGEEDPVIVAAWFHHRFTQIHPYQDGNGRVARALTTLILLQANLLPLVIDRDLRTEYITALEVADFGDLSTLAGIFARLERAAILSALSIDVDSDASAQRTLTAAVIQSLAAKFNKRMELKHAELRAVNSVAVELRARTRRVIERHVTAVTKITKGMASPQVHVADGGPDHSNAHWYKFEVVRSAKEAGKYANFDEDHYFIKASIRIDRERLVFVTSFHHVGNELSGIMEATSFARLESFEESDDRERASQDFFVCSLEPFVFTYKTKPAEIFVAFDKWLDQSLAIALKEYADRL
jgi:hypothetical protein